MCFDFLVGDVRPLTLPPQLELLTVTTTSTLSPEALAFFLDLAEDAGNWSGSPLVDCNKQQEAYLTHAKIEGLLTTERDGRCRFAYFTPAGVALAAQHGVDLSFYYQS